MHIYKYEYICICRHAYHTREVFSSRVLMCVRLHVYVCMYACARVCMCMHACAQNTHSFSSSALKDLNTKVVHVCVSACTDVCVRVCKCVCACVRVCASVCERQRTREHACACVCVYKTPITSAAERSNISTPGPCIYMRMFIHVYV